AEEWWEPRWSSQITSATSADPHRAAVLVPAVTHTRRLLAVPAHHHHVADVERRLLGDDAALLRAAHALGDPGVLLHAVDTFDDHAVAIGDGQDDLPLRASVLAGDHLDRVALLHVQSHQSTSGAREMIRMNRFSRSSRPTGPKMRVPRGSPLSRMSTAAFSSNLMYEPSARRRSLTVRTTTAFTTSPLFTPAAGSASFTVATMMSPISS